MERSFRGERFFLTIERSVGRNPAAAPDAAEMLQFTPKSPGEKIPLKQKNVEFFPRCFPTIMELQRNEGVES